MAGPLPPKIRAALDRALTAGDPDPARRFHDILVKHPSVPVAALFRLAMLEGQRGGFPAADRLLSAASGRQPGDPQLLVNHAQVRMALGDPTGALSLLANLPETVKANPAVLKLTGDAALSANRLEEAANAYGAVPMPDPALLSNHGTVLRRLGRFDEAAAKLAKAVEAGAGREAVVGLAGLYGQLDQHDRAADLLRAHLAPMPSDSLLLRQLAATSRAAGDGPGARLAVHRSAIADPADSASLTLLAELAENAADLDTAETWAKRALAVNDGATGAALVGASVARRRGDPERSLAIVSSWLDQTPPAIRHLMLFERARSLEAAGRPEEAIAAFAEANAQQMEMATPRRDPARALEQLRALEALHRAAPPTGNGEHGSDLLFVVGFPRSGTTLLDQVLDAHPSIEVIEERPLIAAMIADLTLSGRHYPGDLGALSEAEIARLRESYRARLARYARGSGMRYTVDKMPLNMAHVALIRLVFPGARFILALRHPCDVVLSCFMQTFVLNDWMAAYATLESAAELYKAVFRTWESYGEATDLPVMTVRYEHVVEDLEREARRIAAFLNLPFDPAMLSFHSHARARGILATPSASQVTQPIYRTAVARWRRYASVMDPIAERLSAEIKRYGYSEEKG